MSEERTDDTYSDDEARLRFETALRAALNTPPKPLKERPPKRARLKRKGREQLNPPA
jgi:hypothetical protein